MLSRRYGFYLSLNADRHHYPVLDDLSLLHDSDNISAYDVVADRLLGDKIPFLFVVDSRDFNSSAYSVARHLDKLIERSLNAVVYALDYAGSKLYAEGSIGGYYLCARAKSARLFIYLNRRPIVSEFDDLAYKIFFANSNDVKHLTTAHSLRHD